MLLRIFNDTSPLINVTLEKQRVAQQAKEAEAEGGEKEAVDVADLPSPEEPAAEPVKEEAASETKAEEAA